MDPEGRTNNLLNAALAYGAKGWRVIPLHSINGKGVCTCLDPKCTAPGKHPRFPGWPKLASTDPGLINSWWAKWFVANIGVVMGGGLVDIEHEFGFEDNLQRLEAKLGPLPDTVTWTSGGGGVHQVFQTSTPIRCKTRIGQDILEVADTGVDVKGEGGFAILPPSNHHSGGEYTWGNLGPDTIDVAELPEAWLEYLGSDESHTGRLSGDDEPAGNTIPKGQRNSALASLAGSMRHVGMSQGEILAALHKVNSDRCEAPLPDREVEKVAASICRYEPDQVAVAVAENHFEQDQEEVEPETRIEDPGPLPESLLHVPGFIDAVKAYTLDTAPFPEPTLAFCGALALQATLLGRKVKDPSGSRPSLYLLGLANSGSGKDHPRKVNQRVLLDAGLHDQLGDNFASGEGIEDRMEATKTVLFQTDEIDAMLLGISKSRDGRAERIMEVLLKFYSAADCLYHMRVKAGQEAKVINQPHLVLFGTAIPQHYYQSLCEKMLTNGFFARMLVFEAGKRSRGQEPIDKPLPKVVQETARWWAQLRTGNGNLSGEHPNPMTVAFAPGGREALAEIREIEANEYDAAQEEEDAISMALWARAGEKARRLALIYACSKDRKKPRITPEAVHWGWCVVSHMTRRMLYQVGLHVSDTDFEHRCRLVLEYLKQNQCDHKDRWVPFRDVSRAHRWSRRDHDEVRDALIDQERLLAAPQKTGGRPRFCYKMLGGK